MNLPQGTELQVGNFANEMNLMKADLQWKGILHGRLPLMEDDLREKANFDGKRIFD